MENAPGKTVLFCENCRFYRLGAEGQDFCIHEKAAIPNACDFVRLNAKAVYQCVAMRAGICGGGALFEPARA